MGLFFRKTLEVSLVQLGLGLAFIWILLTNKDVPICYRFSNAPLPNQRFARAAFLIAGIVLIMGGIWGLWNEWHAHP